MTSRGQKRGACGHLMAAFQSLLSTGMQDVETRGGSLRVEGRM